MRAIFPLLLVLSLVSWASPEVCNGVDDDGDGAVDEGPVAWGRDDDGDGAGSATELILLPDCSSAPPGGVAPTDCDDGDPGASAGAPERCNGSDDDCDGEIDEGACEGDIGIGDGTAWMVTSERRDWPDAFDRCVEWGWQLATLDTSAQHDAMVAVVAGENDFFWIGYDDRSEEGEWEWIDGGSGTFTNWREDEPNDGGPNRSEDCAVMEDTSLWDDQECDENKRAVCEIPCGTRTWYVDADGDGLGDPLRAEVDCEPASGRAANGADCDDGDPSWPRVGYLDADRDGHGTTARVSCPGDGDAPVDGDCDDGDREIRPDATDLAGDGIDQDCDGYDTPAEEPSVPEPTGDDDDDDAPVAIDSDGDGVLDPADAEALDPGGAHVDPPEPPALCGCAGTPGPVGWLVVVAVAGWGRRHRVIPPRCSSPSPGSLTRRGSSSRTSR